MRRLGGALDSLEMAAALVSVPILTGLIFTGHVPRDMELFGVGVAGVLLLVGIARMARVRRKANRPPVGDGRF